MNQYEQAPVYVVDSAAECVHFPTLIPVVRAARRMHPGGEFDIVKQYPIHRGVQSFLLGRFHSSTPLVDITDAVMEAEARIVQPPPPRYDDGILSN